MNLVQGIIIISLLSFIFIGLLAKRSCMDSYAEFTMCKNKLNWFIIATGVSMTFTGGAAILTTASIGYMFKWYALVDPFAVLIGFFIVVFLYKTYKDDKGVTISDLLACNYKKLSFLIGMITSSTFVLIVAANFLALSKLIAPYFPSISPQWLTFITATLVFSYVYSGGFNSVTKTDILQCILIICLLIVPILFFIIGNGSQIETTLSNHQFVAMPIDYIVLFLMPILFVPLSQDINLRIKSAKNQINGKIGLIMGGIFYTIIVLCTAYVGIYLGYNSVDLPDPEQAVPLFFKNNFPKIGLVAIIASMAAIMSTLDSYILNAITSISNDIIKPFTKKNLAQRNIKIASLITYLIAMAIALYFNKILVLTLTSMLIYISVLFPVALGKYLNISEKKIFIAAIINISIIVVLEITAYTIGPKALVYPVIGGVIMLIMRTIQSLFKK